MDNLLYIIPIVILLAILIPICWGITRTPTENPRGWVPGPYKPVPTDKGPRPKPTPVWPRPRENCVEPSESWPSPEYPPEKWHWLHPSVQYIVIEQDTPTDIEAHVSISDCDVAFDGVFGGRRKFLDCKEALREAEKKMGMVVFALEARLLVKSESKS